MTVREAREFINLNPDRYFANAKKKGYVCPLCGNGAGKDGTGLALNPNDRARSHYKCFRCGAYGDVVEFVKLGENLSSNSVAFARACELYGISLDRQDFERGSEVAGESSSQDAFRSPSEDAGEVKRVGADRKPYPEGGNVFWGDFEALTRNRFFERFDGVSSAVKRDVGFERYFAACHEAVKDTDYWAMRGIGAGLIARFCLGFDPAWVNPKAPNSPPSPRVVIPTSGDSYAARYAGSGENPYKVVKVGSVRAFNSEALWGVEPVFVTEGEIDALSVMEVGANAVALGGVSNVRRFLELCSEKKPSATLIISLDNDVSGEVARDKLAAGLRELGVPFFVKNISGSCVDANDAMLSDKESFSNAVQDALRSLSEDLGEAKGVYRDIKSASGRLSAFWSEIEAFNDSAVNTGFKNLDSSLGGGLYEGFYVLGGMTSVGKTSFVLQMADQIAMNGRDVLLCSLEMSARELIAKSISRITFERNRKLAKSAREILDGRRYAAYSAAERENIRLSAEKYRAFCNRIFIADGLDLDGLGGIRSVINEHLSAISEKPVVIIDYLQILDPCNGRASDKQNVDRSVCELKRVSREFGIPVVAISSLNRASYKNGIELSSFKETGGIEYSADVLLGLEFYRANDLNSHGREKIRKMELKVIKNRNGVAGESLLYDYCAAYNDFREHNFDVSRLKSHEGQYR